MLAAGLWSRARKSRGASARRARHAHFGDLVQLDGSFHEWLEAPGPRGCLMNLVDDATGPTLAAGRTGDHLGRGGSLAAWIEKYGVPRALYTDWKNVYVREPTAKEPARARP